MTEWQDISTAPLETRILLWCADLKRTVFGRVIEVSAGEREAYADGMSGDWAFTHWMPLPEPPGSR